jgi:HD-GYP domain-containing protein (c-di-GMP phosphodiesterase class II)
MDNHLIQFILTKQKVEFAVFDSSLQLKTWSENLSKYLSDQMTLERGAPISEVFLELVTYEDILTKIRVGERAPLTLDRIENTIPPTLSKPWSSPPPEYHDLHVYSYEGDLLVVVRDVSSDGVLEQSIIQRRNELNLLNVQLIDNLKVTNEELLNAYGTTLEGWAAALELRDVETKGHSERVMDMTIKLFNRMGVNRSEINSYCYGSLLHDIGKMGIPDRILLKPGSLDESEWEVMHQHPVNAYNLLSPIRYIKDALDIPHFHHEKWDGSGYPHGLKGVDIPFPARLFAVVDVFDALTSKRPYRPAWTLEDALQYIRAQSGIHFDPDVVDNFLSLM